MAQFYSSCDVEIWKRLYIYKFI